MVAKQRVVVQHQVMWEVDTSLQTKSASLPGLVLAADHSLAVVVVVAVVGMTVVVRQDVCLILDNRHVQTIVSFHAYV